jgi:tetratricopeptide (TPR) repeat protein
LCGVYQAIQHYDVPGWRVFVQLMEGSLVLISHGDLNRALDIAIQALTTAESLADSHSMALRLGARLLVLRCWLKVDEVGYAQDVLSVVDDVLDEYDLGTWAYWFWANKAWALWALGRHDEADVILDQMLVALPAWTRMADAHEGRAYIAYRLRRQAESVRLYTLAGLAFEEAGLRYGATRCLLNRALCLHELGEHAHALIVLAEALPRALDLANPHYLALAHCFRGRCELALGRYQVAADELTAALRLYERRGWLRDEAVMAIERLDALDVLGRGEGWAEAVAYAKARVALLRSCDLQPRLAALIDE